MSAPLVIAIVWVGALAIYLWFRNRKYRIEKGDTR